MKAWFVEERLNHKWAPVLYHGDMPTERPQGGARRKFLSTPVQVKESDTSLPLDLLQRLYGAKENAE